MGTQTTPRVRLRLRSYVSGEGEYIIPTSTVFGLKQEELDLLLKEGLKVARSSDRETAKSFIFRSETVTGGLRGWRFTGLLHSRSVVGILVSMKRTFSFRS